MFSRFEAKEIEEGLFIIIVHSDAFLQEITKVLVPVPILFTIALSFIRDHLDCTTCEHVAKLSNEAAILVVFTRYVQW